LLPCHSFSHKNLKSPCAEQLRKKLIKLVGPQIKTLAFPVRARRLVWSQGSLLDG
jgi:hypothetical protein